MQPISVPETMLFFGAMLFLSVLLEPLSTRLRFPHAIILMAIGYIGSEFLIFAGFDTGLRWYHFKNIGFYVILPVLIFEAALNINARMLLKMIVPILILALPVFFISIFISMVIIYFGIGHSDAFPLIAAMLTAVIISATDPEAVEMLCIKMKAPDKLTMLFRGESIFNDAGSIVLYSAVMGFALSQQVTLNACDAMIRFLFVFFGGFLWGAAVGFSLIGIFKIIHNEMSRALLSLIFAYAIYLSAELYFQISGVMAMLAAGLLLSYFLYEKPGAKQNPFFKKLWSFSAHTAHAVIFLLVGMTITLAMFRDRWLAMLIAIAAVIIARAAGILLFFPILNKMFFVRDVDKNMRFVLFWGGLRGAIVVALALSLPLELEYWYTIQSMAYGVVLFTFLFQATTIHPLIRRTVQSDT